MNEFPRVRRLLGVVAVIAVGAVFLIASLPDGTKLLAARENWSWLAGPGEASAALKAALPPAGTLLRWVGYAVAAYVVALVLLSWRHRRAGLAGWGLGVLVASTFALHGVAWFTVVVRFIGRVVGAVLGFLFLVLGWIVKLVYTYLLKPLIGLFGPLLGVWAWIGVLVLVVVVLWVAHEARARWARRSARPLVLVALVLGAVWLISELPAWFWRSAASIGGAVLGWLVAAVVCSMVGKLFLDQLRSGAHAGSDRRGVVMGAIAVGTTLAVLMLVGNVYGAYALYPSSVSDWARATLLSDAPKVDATVSMVVIGLCVLGVLRNLSVMRPEPSLAEFRRSLLFTIVGIYVAGSVAALDKDTSD